jgi:hypothetical protein
VALKVAEVLEVIDVPPARFIVSPPTIYSADSADGITEILKFLSQALSAL